MLGAQPSPKLAEMENIMDTLRNLDPHFPSADTAPDYAAFPDAEEEEETVTVESPVMIGQDERRMHVRAYNFWAGMLGDRKFPDIEDLDPEAHTDFRDKSVLLDFTNGVENPAIAYLGALLRAECEMGAPLETIDDVPARSLLSRITDHYLQIIANGAPIGFEAEFVNQRGVNVMYRGILLPFSSDDDTIDFIYGVINWKECAQEAQTSALEVEVDQIMRAAPERVAAGPVWADGPTSTPSLDEFIIPRGGVLTGSSEQVDADAGGDAGPEPEADAGLADWLVAARCSALHARDVEQRSRQALYIAIGRAYDFMLMTRSYPEDFAEILADAGIAVQDRAPMTAVVKLIFGADYDKTRLTEFAAVLRFADQQDLARGTLADYLARTQGGLKAVVRAERIARRTGERLQLRPSDSIDPVRERLRRAPARSLAQIDAGTQEFVLLVARRDDAGALEIVGPVQADERLTDSALRKVQIG
jgi:hypothetical protein